jgi:TolB-like protein
MADVFISYAHTTSRQAQAAAASLRAAGYSVWLDDDLAVHRAFTQAIEEQLAAAKAALVIWSADAAKSQWVLSEANRAREDGKLVQLVIDKTRLPMPFDQVQCADFSGWSGDSEHPNWRRVIYSIGELVEGKGSAPTLPRPTPPFAMAPTSAEPLLAVLAFDNLSGDPEMAYFSDGVSQEILDTVAQGSDIKVIARGSSFQLRGADKTARKVAAELNATHILDGAVRRAGQRVRISAQLVECASETSLWVNRFDRELEDIFALQDEIAAAVAEALKKAFAPRAVSASIDPEVYEQFLKAQAIQHGPDSFTQASIEEGLGLLERVVAREPGFARAWELLAIIRAKALRFGWSSQPFAPARAAAEDAVERALALDPACGGAYAALMDLEPWGAHQAREEWAMKALAAAPGDAGVLLAAARAIGSVGRRSDGMRYADEARTLDPLLPMAQFWYASALAGAGRVDEALPIFESLQANSQGTSLGDVVLWWAARLRRWDLFDRWRDAALAAGIDPGVLGGATANAERLRHPDPSAVAAVAEACRAEVAATGTISLTHLLALDDCGETELAFELAETASFAHMFRADGPPPAGPNALSTIFIPRLEGGMLRDPRFVRWCAKLGLVHYWLETGKWPDCADQVPYDFRAECRHAAAEGLAAHV